MITFETCQKQPFDIIAMTPRGTIGLCCVHIAQLMTHPGVYTLPFTLQLCYKRLGILQRVTKSQKVHISSHDGLKKLQNINLLDIGPKASQGRSWVAEISPFPIKHFEEGILRYDWPKELSAIIKKKKKKIVNNFKKLDNVPLNVTTIHLYL